MSAAAEKRATQTLRKLGIAQVPIPVEDIAEHLGLRLQSFALGDDVSGVLVVDGDAGVIGYNSSHHTVRQRFTIAHEIGHYLLHRGDSSLFIDERYFAVFRDKTSSQGIDRREREANAFAAALLMPSQLIREEVHLHDFDFADEDALSSLASKFQVSAQSMAYRLSRLGLFTINS